MSNDAIFCVGCGYDLRSLPVDGPCPECGRAFDPNWRRTYRTKPRGRWWTGRLLRTAAALFAILFAVVGVGGGWVYWRYTVEMQSIEKLKASGLRYRTRPLFAPRLADWLKNRGLPVVETVVSVRGNDLPPRMVPLSMLVWPPLGTSF